MNKYLFVVLILALPIIVFGLSWEVRVNKQSESAPSVVNYANITINGIYHYCPTGNYGESMFGDYYFDVNEGDVIEFSMGSNGVGYETGTGLSIINHLGIEVVESWYYAFYNYIPGEIIVSRPETLEIISPDGGESFVGGTTVAVSHTPKTIQGVSWWFNESNQTVTPITYIFPWNVYLSQDNGSSWSYLHQTDGVSGLDFITLPDSSSTQCLVKMGLVNGFNPNVCDTSNNVFSIESNPTLPKTILDYPSLPGLYLRNGTYETIDWTRNNVASTALDLTTDGGITWSEIASGIVADYFNWVVPDLVTPNARIRVRSVDNPNVLDYSDNSFQIYHLDLISPNGGEIWMAGSTQIVSWHNPSNYPLELFITYDGGSNWMLVATLSGVQGVYYYTVPTLNSTQCKMKIHSTSNNAYYDISDTFFSISTSSILPKLILSYPSTTGINLQVGQSVNLGWTRQNVVEVDLELSADNGDTWTEIVSGLDAISYAWLVSDNPSTGCRIRVKSSLDPGVADLSDNSFTISKIQILSPLGGELLTSDYSSGYALPISWSAAGMTNVKLEYSSNGGASWASISNSYNAATGVFNWVLPGIPSTNYKVRISNAVNTAINSVSESFTLRNPIKLTNANGGGFVTNGSLFTILWANQDVDPGWNVWWEYSLNNSTWIRLYANATSINAQQLSWFVTTGLDSSVWLRAMKSTDNRIIGKSEASFVVTDKSLLLSSPMGGEEYNALSTQTVSWEAEGCSNLNISLSTDDGVSWTSIATNIPASQLSYQWLVPETPSVNCRIKLSDISYSYMNLMSDACFSIMPLQIVPPTVDFSADVLTGDIPLAVQFAEEVNPGVGNIASRLWDFGDGNTSNQANPLHTYIAAGTYTVSLTITNDFGGSTNETKADYVTALPNTPRIELLSAANLNYGIVYLGDTSPAQIIEVKNVGTAPMIISSVSYYLANSQFALSGTELPITVPVNGTAQLSVVFVPISSGAVCDSICIHSDASNLPALAVKLSAIGEYVPPASVEGLVVTVVGNDAQLTWQPVTTTIYGTPIDPDGYIVLYNETPYEDEHFYYFLSFVTGTNFVHPFVAQYRQQMFYRIVAVKNYREDAIAYLMSLNGSRDRYTWGSIMDALETLKQRQ